MNGTVTSICLNNWGNRTYGFILGDDGNEYFFHKNSLVRISISSLQKDDRVEFSPAPSRQGTGKMEAISVRKYIAQSSTMLQFATKGVHPDLDLETFKPDEKEIIKTLSEALFITHSGRTLTVGNCQYRYALVKPTEDYAVNFNLQREIPVVFSASSPEADETKSYTHQVYQAKSVPFAFRKNYNT